MSQVLVADGVGEGVGCCCSSSTIRSWAAVRAALVWAVIASISSKAFCFLSLDRVVSFSLSWKLLIASFWALICVCISPSCRGGAFTALLVLNRETETQRLHVAAVQLCADFSFRRVGATVHAVLAYYVVTGYCHIRISL